MAHSVEARLPFLDHRFVEACNTLPPSTKIRFNEKGEPVEKFILREALKPFINDELYRRPKQPYVAPQALDDDSPTMRMIRDTLTEKNVCALGFFNWTKVKELLDSKQESKGPDLLKICSLVILHQRLVRASFCLSNATFQMKIWNANVELSEDAWRACFFSSSSLL